jgi:hypothetical protein
MSVPTSLGNNVNTRQYSWMAMVLESWGEEWGRWSWAYEFSSGERKLSTDSTNRGFYVPSNNGASGN